MATVLLEQEIEIPTIRSLAEFRRWALSDGRGAASFVPAESDSDGYQRSDALDASYQLERNRHQRGHWIYRLRLK